MTKPIKSAVVADARVLREKIIHGPRLHLSREFMMVCERFILEASPRDMLGLLRFGMPPFSTMWMEWNATDEDEEVDGRFSVIVDRDEEQNDGPWANSCRIVHAFEVDGRKAADYEGMPMAFLPISVRTRFTGAAFAINDIAAIVSHGGMAKEVPNLTETLIMESMANLFSADWSARAAKEDRPTVEEIIRRCAVLPLGMAGEFVYEGARGAPQADRQLFIEQMERSFNLMRGLPLLVGVILGMLSLHTIRHVVETRDYRRRDDQPNNNWRWRHDHKVVTLTRPITTREVVRKVYEGREGSGRILPLHTVTGHWRVRGGRPTCNHRWKMRVDDAGQQMGSSQFICSECAALRCFVRDYQRGTPEHGLLTKDYEVEAPARSSFQ
jgi:hypothetical protein